MGIQISTDESRGQSSFIIKTSSAEYHYQQAAGGFARIIDSQGRDWVNFKRTDLGVPGDAAGLFRGVPNLVFPDNIGHPGHEHCRSSLVSRRDSALIRTVSRDGLWEWTWEIDDSRAVLNMTRVPLERSYWFLFEGPVGGDYNPGDSFWGTDTLGRRRDTPDLIPGDPAPVYDSWRWIYLGRNRLDRVFYIRHDTAEGETNLFSYMGNVNPGIGAPDGMAVAGFGRGEGTTSLLRGKHMFSMGFLETADHGAIALILNEKKH